ncbi:hypothetical protein GQ55_2G456000 [Panicum hallii var. hallii]|uniref:DUF630 domain-containing protein n=1 Tax=Panicum hallii var. hallii TaxID=1504633 RepID=A0A2T7EZF5_9POAL|nr:hypothetical protein GQ55_2G456000 [Panicum hallii var. hallii]
MGPTSKWISLAALHHALLLPVSFSLAGPRAPPGRAEPNAPARPASSGSSLRARPEGGGERCVQRRAQVRREQERAVAGLVSFLRRSTRRAELLVRRAERPSSETPAPSSFRQTPG